MKTNYHIITILATTLLFYSCKNAIGYDLQEGDLLFQDVDCGPFCEAIEAVTQGIDNYNFSHIGLVMKSKNGDLKVMEAVSKGVVLTPIDSFLNRSLDDKKDPKVIVGRLKPELRHLIPETICFINSNINAEYDPYFDINNDKYYCSELIHLAFKSANNDEAIFKVLPMTYKSPNTQETFGIWETYFKKLQYPVPEGQPGLNPGGMSLSPFIDIVHHFGEPSKRVTD